MKQQELGQYFTTSEIILDDVRRLVMNRNGIILEPSSGVGNIIQTLVQNGETRPIKAVVIDESLKSTQLVISNQVDQIFDNFLTHQFDEKFSTIVGNPPYVKIKNQCNLYIQFIERAIELLEPNGELVFIIPTDYLFLTSGAETRVRMVESGSITHIIRYDDERLFKNASQDVMVIRYQHGILNQPTRFIRGNSTTTILPSIKGGIIYSFNANETIGDIFSIHVGMISGLDKVFRTDEFGTHSFLTRNGKITKYVFVENFPTGDTKLDEYLLKNKSELMKRRIFKVNENNWFLWGAVRNYNIMKSDDKHKCIFVETLTRNHTVAFIHERTMFDGNLLCLVPKDKNTDLKKWITALNSDNFRNYFIQAGRFKMGQRVLANCPVPF